MNNNRFVSIVDSIDRSLADRVIFELSELDKIARDPIRLFIASTGGDVFPGLRICDRILEYTASPVITIGKDLVSSTAAAVFASGALRLLYDKTTMLFHHVYHKEKETIEHWNYTDFLAMEKKYLLSTHLYLLYCTRKRRTHLNPCPWSADQFLEEIDKYQETQHREIRMDAQTAEKHGFADAVIQNFDEIRLYENKLKMPLPSPSPVVF
jgi:ATP-dependent protease ClpP protease subunit